MTSQPVETTTRDGSRLWVLPDGRLHRLDGPAAIFADGYRVWSVDEHGVPDPGGVLDRLYDDGDTTTLVAVLSVWQPGIDIADLVIAYLNA